MFTPSFYHGKDYKLTINLRENVINLNTIAEELGHKVGAKMRSTKKIGLTYIPPLNAEIKIISPIQQPNEAQKNMISAGLNDTDQIPSHFSWEYPEDVNKWKGWKTTKTFLQNPINQYSCGLCWAISSATMLGDRFAIFSRGLNPELSYTYIASCMPKSLKCQGGFPANAGKFLEKNGTVKNSCWDYSWCSDNKKCTDGLPGLSELIPQCSTGDECNNRCQGGSCYRTGNTRHYKAQSGSTQSIVNINAIKLDILNYGPVVATYRVFADFLIGSMPHIKKDKKPDFWSKTNNIYINIQGKDIYGYGNLQCDGKMVNASECFKGNHAIVIVGWGVDHDITINSKSSVSVPYWIIRNSWGKDWNTNGYFKMAISNPDEGFNMQCALDRGLIINGIKIGGVTTFKPNIKMAPSGVVQHFNEEVYHNNYFKLYENYIIYTIFVLIVWHMLPSFITKYKLSAQELIGLCVFFILLFVYHNKNYL